MKWIGIIGLVFAIAGASSSHSGPAGAATKRVVMEGVDFKPSVVAATVGDTVRWINESVVPHTVTFPDGEFDVEVLPGDSVQLVIMERGRQSFGCSYHAGMTGTITASGE